MILYENNIQHQTKTGTNITITNTLNTRIDDLRMSKLSTQYTTTGQNLYNVYDKNVFTSGVSVDSDGWISASYDNSSGSTAKYLNIWTHNLDLTTSTTYYIITEIKAVSGTGRLILSDSTSTSQFTNAVAKTLAGLVNNFPTTKIYKDAITTKSSYSSSIYGLRSFLEFNAGQSGSITFRISVVASNSITPENFVYEPYTNGPAPNPDFPMEVNTIKGYSNLAYTGWAEDFVTRINDNTKAKLETYDSKNCLAYFPSAGYGDYDNKYVFKIAFKENTQYTFLYDKYSTSGWGDMDITYTDGTKQELGNVLTANAWNKVKFTSQPNKTVKYLSVHWRANAFQYIDLDTFMVIEGTEKLPYVPYGSNYVYTDIVGKNVYNPALCPSPAMKTSTGFTFTNLWATVVIPTSNIEELLEPNTTYTCYTKYSCTNVPSEFGQYESNNKLILYRTAEEGGSVWTMMVTVTNKTEEGGVSCNTFTTPSDLTNCRILGYDFKNTSNTTVGTITLSDFMIVKGSYTAETILPYQAYKGGKTLIPLNNNEICGIGNYKDELIVDKNGHCYLNKKIGKVVLDGSENVVREATQSNYRFDVQSSLNFKIPTSTERANLLCNKLVSKTGTELYMEQQGIKPYKYGDTYYLQMYIDATKQMTTTDFKTWLASNNLVVYAELETPQLIDLNYTADIEMVEGINYISNSNDMDMTIIFASYLDINKNGLGYLNNVISANITEELNGEYKLVFDYPLDDILSDEIQEERIVKCQVADGTQQCFVIKNVVKTYEKITATCTHLFYMLLNDIAEDIYPQNLSPKPFLDWVIARANYVLPFTTTSDVSVQKTARYVRKNLVEVILGEQDNSMVNLFGIEIKRNNWNIGLQSRIGADNGEKLIYGKNITGINVNIDTSGLYTRIMPVGYDGLLLPEKYVDATNINNYPYPKISIIEFSEIRYDPEDETAYQTLEEAYTALRNAVQELYDNGINQPKINVKVNWLELSKTEEYKQYSNLERVNLGDTIHAEIFGLNYTTRVVKIVYNPLNDRVEQFEIGTLQPDYASQMNKYEFDLQQINPASILDEAKDNATNLITNAMGGYVYKTNEELYIMDNADPNQAVHVWRWNINGLGYSSTGINGTYGLAMTMDGAIVADFITTGVLRTSVIQGYDSLTTQVSNNTGAISILTQSVGELNSKIQDIADITTAAESEYAEVQLLNVNESQPIQIKIRPLNSINISYLYPRNSLYPSNSLYMPDRIIKFTNTSTNEVFTYELFDDLLYYDSTHYDEFYWDYDSETIQITKNCEYDASGNVVLKATPVIETRTFPSPSDFYLTTGNYTISLPGYSNAYLSVRCMASNIYTSQFATRSELSQTATHITTNVAATYATITEAQRLDSKIDQTATSITSSVSQNYESKTDATNSYNQLNSTITQTASAISSQVSQKVGNDEIISKINQTPETITISANKINIDGTITAINNNTSTKINGGKITTGSITATQIASNTITSAKVNSSIITTSNFSAQSISASKITSGSLTSSNVKIGSWNLNGTGITSSNARIYPNYLGYQNNGSWVSCNWLGIGKAGTAYSDKKIKKNIKSLDDKFNGFFDELKPVRFKYKRKIKDDKTYIGFVAQDIEKSLKDNDLEDLSMLYKDEDLLCLDKREIIALNTWQIQLLKKEIKELKKEIEELKKER